MGLFITCCGLFAVLFNFNLDRNLLNQAFQQPVSFLRSVIFTNNLPVQTKDSESYTVALVGDSMTESLGTADSLRDSLKNYYPDKGFGILNFGIGSTSILSVPDRLRSESKRGAETLPGILTTKPDIILLESFGNNPLSEMPLEKGLKKQTETLDKVLKIVEEGQPDTVLIFVATISPSEEKYAQGVVDLSPDQRRVWVNERIAYIKNHINYAKSHKIPLVNIYENSLNEEGRVNLDYLNSSDFIHPSPAGVQFITRQIADFIFTKKIIPD